MELFGTFDHVGGTERKWNRGLLSGGGGLFETLHDTCPTMTFSKNKIDFTIRRSLTLFIKRTPFIT